MSQPPPAVPRTNCNSCRKLGHFTNYDQADPHSLVGLHGLVLCRECVGAFAVAFAKAARAAIAKKGPA